MPRPTGLGASCEHGHLARSCQICDRDEEIESLTDERDAAFSRADEAEARAERLAAEVIATRRYDWSNLAHYQRDQARAAVDANGDLKETP